jgi:hypothetical protein
MLAHQKVLPIDAAVALAMEVGQSMDARLTPQESQMIQLIAQSCKTLDVDGTPFVYLEELRGFVTNLQKAIVEKDSSFLMQRRGLRVDRVVDVQEFVESREFMGQAGYIRPKVLEGLIELFGNERYIECVLSGSIGWGKTYFGYMAIGYMIYLLSCYHNPQAEFDLAPGTTIVFIQQSKTYQLAKKVVFEQFSELLRQSPYFKNSFPYDPGVKSELRFPKNILVLPVGGSDTAALGMNVFGGIIDEMNFMQRTRDSVNVQHTNEEEYDQAERLYTTIRRRMTSRFMQRGRLPGKLLLVSSVNYPDDFTSRKMEEARTDPTILAITHSQWAVLPADRFCGDTFLVEVGNEFKQSRILRSIEEAVDVSDVLNVPVEYRTEFERDLESALRDLAGVTSGTRNPFIPYRQEIIQAAEEFGKATDGRQLFRMPEININEIADASAPDWSRIADVSYIDECLLDRSQPFAVHLDVALSEDCCGLAVGHIAGYKMLPSTKFYSERRREFVEIRDIRAPIYQIDGVLRVVPPRGGGEIDLQLLRDLVLWLRGELFIKWGTCDSYQSAMMIQAFRKARVRSGVLSVDQSIAPYTELKLATKDGRLLIPYHEMLMKEMREVEKCPDKDKVDHPPGGSKDCADAVAGVVFMLQTKEASYGRPVASRRTVDGQSVARGGGRVRKVRMGNSRRR